MLAEVVRSGFVESRHHGSVLAVHADGRAALALGDVDAPVFPRSSNKPLQAAGMARLGLPLAGELLALAAASHSGEPFHVDGVRRILAVGGLDESALQTPADWPLDPGAARDVVRAGGDRAPVLMNCSGKHAAMLVTCVVNGWDTAGYLQPGHPLQEQLRATTGDLAGEPVEVEGVDGCGAPLFGLSLRGLARAFAALATAAPETAEGAVAAAMRSHPSWVGGTGATRDVTRFMRVVPGLIAKDGAEGVYAAALPDGRAAALKIDDGGERPRRAVLTAALRLLGADGADLAGLGETPVRGGGQPVGGVRLVAGLGVAGA